MPEMPEVEAVSRLLHRDAAGSRIVRLQIERARITAPQDPREVETAASGRRIDAVNRRGKNILVHLAGGRTLHVHLRMTGNLRVIPDARLRAKETSAWALLDDGRGLVFEDTRGLGTLRVHEVGAEPEFDLGPEPLSPDFSAGSLVALALASRQPAKLFLMDQRRIAGLGNIYAAEALWQARVNPVRVISTVSRTKLRALHAAIVRVLEDAVKSACIAYSRPGRFREAEEYSPAVYDREGQPCLRCRRAIRRITQAGRSTYYCPRCQR